MPERFECTSLAKRRYINILPFLTVVCLFMTDQVLCAVKNRFYSSKILDHLYTNHRAQNGFLKQRDLLLALSAEFDVLTCDIMQHFFITNSEAHTRSPAVEH